MDEILFTCVGLVFVLCLLATAVVGWIAFARVRKLERKLERELARLRARVDAQASSRETLAAHPVEVHPVEVPRPAPPAPRAQPPRELARAPAPAPLPSAASARPEVREAAERAATFPPRAPRAPVEPARIDWERWLGVRGFAVVGGILLALSAIYFFQHAITHGWIPPWARVASGIGAGLAGIAGAARLRKKEFAWAPSALEGAGVVALYASLWAAQQRYALIGAWLAFPGMALVTLLAGWLALKHGSLFSALLGLAGGFATPLLLSEGSERPLPLFGYVLLLDLGLLFVARKRQWTALALLALACTQLLLAGWIFARDDGALPGLGFALLFAALFALTDVQPSRATRGLALATQALGLLAPFAFAVHYASALDLGRHFGWTAAYLALLSVLATVVARRPDAGWLASASALACAAVTGTWFVGLAPGERSSADGELVLIAAGLAGLAHLFAEWEHRRAARRSARQAALAASLAWSGLLLSCDALMVRPPLGPWLLLGGVALFAAALVRQAHLLGRAEFLWVPGVTLGLALARLATRRAEFEQWNPPDARLLAALAVLLGALFLRVVPRCARTLERRATEAAAALAGVFTFVTHVLGASALHEPHPWLAGGLAFGLGALTWSAAARRESSPLGLLAALIALSWTERACSYPLMTSHGAWEQQVLATCLAAWIGAAGLTLFAASTGTRLGRARVAWAALALGGVLAVAPLAGLQLAYRQRVPLALDFDALPFLALAVPELAAAAWLARRGAGVQARAWLAGAGLFLLAFGIAVTLGREGHAWTSMVFIGREGAWLEGAELAVGAALAALGLAALAWRLGIEGPRWVATGLAGLTLLPLLLQLVRHGVYPRQGFLAAWVAYEHLVPAAAFAGALALLPPTDAGLPQRVRRAVLGSTVFALVFLWLNWTIENAFAEGKRVTFFAARGHARDLVTSLAWGGYGMGLLLLGTWRRAASLRWASLAMLLLSIAKVFLHDLGHLDGLFRVASLAGLALSLIAVSLFYQRFVFGKVGLRASAKPPLSPS